ncbi:hypothetical protein [Xanthobacter autotrophicus]|uniref:hypothetical protein n=1 Tax=Xanthobacter autotrophicus TaxID=280 RepID=UPI00372A6B52
MSARVERLARSSGAHMALAFIAMGTWSAFANHAHPMPAPLIAALIQGTISACITLVLKGIIEGLARRLAGLAALVVPPLVAFAFSAIVLWICHTIGGTPEIGRTIALPLTSSIFYSTLYSFDLWRTREGRG